jgi:hypothetical protein
MKQRRRGDGPKQKNVKIDSMNLQMAIAGATRATEMALAGFESQPPKIIHSAILRDIACEIAHVRKFLDRLKE